MKFTFPENPSDKMIFEAIPGLFFQYEKGTNSWVRIDGAGALGLATPIVNGLMSSEDFKKLQGLLIPPPQSSLSGQSCSTAFKSGKVGLFSTDGSLLINDKLDLVSHGVDSPTPWSLHTNTAGIDFKLDLAKFVADIEALGNITKVQLQGDQGPQGIKGDDGKDFLDTGPVGATGPAGQNSTFGGSLSLESLPLQVVNSGQNRAVVDVSTQEVSPTENYLVITRANIGNPDACPQEINPTQFSSKWLLAISESTKPVSSPQSIRIDECTSTCRTCATSLYYLNIDPILNALFDRFKHRLDLLKALKESLVRSWLRTMVELFNEQKAALCCALENCKSRGRNTDTRRYIETQRIQAAIGNFSLVIDGKDDRDTVNMDQFKKCPVPPIAPIQRVVVGQECLQCALTFILDAKQHIVDPRTGVTTQSLSGYLPAGTYVASIDQCCADLDTNTHKFTGRCAILYRAKVVSGSSEEVVDHIVNFPDFGTFDNIAAARNAYQGVTVSFEHAGGDISVWINDPDRFGGNNEGEIDVCIKSERCLGPITEQTVVDTTGSIFVYRGDVKTGAFLGAIKPFVGSNNAVSNYGLASGSAHLLAGPTLEERKAKIFFFEGTDGLSFFFVANKASGTFSTNINTQFTVVNNTLATNVVVADGQFTPAGVGVFGGNWSVIGDTEGGVIGFFDPTGLWSLIIDPTNLGLLTEFDAVSSDGHVVVLALNPNGIGGQVSGLLNTDGLSLTNPCNVPAGFGANCGMALNNKVAGQTVYVRKAISIGATPTPAPPTLTQAPKCGPGTVLASTVLNHGPNPPSNLPNPDNNPGQIFTVQLGNGTPNGPGPFATLLTASVTVPTTQTLTIQCNGIIDSYADATFMQLVDDRGTVLASGKLTHPSFLFQSNGKGSTATINPFNISGTVARNAGEVLTVKFLANYATSNGRLSGSILRDGSTLSIVGDLPCPSVSGGSAGANQLPNPTVAPKVGVTSASAIAAGSGGFTPGTSVNVSYAYADSRGFETLTSPPASVLLSLNPAALVVDFSGVSIPANVTAVNVYVQVAGSSLFIQALNIRPPAHGSVVITRPPSPITVGPTTLNAAPTTNQTKV